MLMVALQIDCNSSRYKAWVPLFAIMAALHVAAFPVIVALIVLPNHTVLCVRRFHSHSLAADCTHAQQIAR